MRTHIVLPESLIEEIDSVVGKRKRSRFVEEAIREKLKKRLLLKELQETAGILLSEEYPQWETAQKTAGWVREIRERGEERFRRSEDE